MEKTALMAPEIALPAAGLLGAGLIGQQAGLNTLTDILRRQDERMNPIVRRIRQQREEQKQEVIYNDSRDQLLPEPDIQDENAPLLSEQSVVDLLAADDDLQPEEAVQVVNEYQQHVVDLQNGINDIVQDERIPENRRVGFREYLLGKVISGVVAYESLRESYDFVQQIYDQYNSWWIQSHIQKHDQLPGIRDDIVAVIQHPTAPHCKRHIWTDNYGKIRTLLVCSDEFGTRSYQDQ